MALHVGDSGGLRIAPDGITNYAFLFHCVLLLFHFRGIYNLCNNSYNSDLFHKYTFVSPPGCFTRHGRIYT